MNLSKIELGLMNARRFAALLVVCVITCGSLATTTQQANAQEDAATVSGKNNGGQNLDLPELSGYVDDEDEDTSEYIQFYGGSYEADGFFFCIDRSGSMTVDGNITILKREMVMALNQLSNRAEFGITSFASNVTSFSPIPQRANSSGKSAAVNWVNGLVADGITCMADGATQLIGISNMCRLRDKTIILLGDGAPNCGSACAPTKSAIRSANYQNTPVNTIFIGSADSNCMQQIAAENGGDHRVVSQ